MRPDGFRPGSSPGRHPVARAQRLDVLIGILGFFTAAALLTAAVAEVQGRAALRQSLVLLLFVLLLAATIRLRSRS